MAKSAAVKFSRSTFLLAVCVFCISSALNETPDTFVTFSVFAKTALTLQCSAGDLGKQVDKVTSVRLLKLKPETGSDIIAVVDEKGPRSSDRSQTHHQLQGIDVSGKVEGRRSWLTLSRRDASVDDYGEYVCEILHPTADGSTSVWRSDVITFQSDPTQVTSTQAFTLTIEATLEMVCQYLAEDPKEVSTISIIPDKLPNVTVAHWPEGASRDRVAANVTFQQVTPSHGILMAHLSNVTCEDAGNYTCILTTHTRGTVGNSKTPALEQCYTHPVARMSKDTLKAAENGEQSSFRLSDPLRALAVILSFVAAIGVLFLLMLVVIGMTRREF
ncbi:hypothetical protein BaRGS_00023016 [Batillaria attramentaria]|uniref:Uncharacterized protein n=1 Tax=Batillaria attramentaria TaxID=370345 RepID=A0ABD0KF16_9CAEN